MLVLGKSVMECNSKFGDYCELMVPCIEVFSSCYAACATGHGPLNSFGALHCEQFYSRLDEKQKAGGRGLVSFCGPICPTSQHQKSMRLHLR